VSTLAGLAAGLRRAADGELAASLARELRTLALEAEGEAKGNATTSPKVRSGVLRRSIVGTLNGQGTTLRLELTAGGSGPAKEYAALQEYGGEVTPKKGRFLAIPQGPALTASGVARFRSAREAPNLRFIAIRGGAMGLLVRDVPGRKARSEIFYVLVRRVKVPATLYLTRALEAVRARAVERIQSALAETVQLHGD